jgi:hypothetical protein
MNASGQSCSDHQAQRRRQPFQGAYSCGCPDAVAHLSHARKNDAPQAQMLDCNFTGYKNSYYL